MKKLVSLFLVLALALGLVPVLAQVDTSEHVVITYLVTGDIPTNKTNDVLKALNEKLTEKINASLLSSGSYGQTGPQSTTWPWLPRTDPSTWSAPRLTG